MNGRFQFTNGKTGACSVPAVLRELPEAGGVVPELVEG